MKTILTSIEIDAAPERVWSVLTDLDAHSHWNPFIRLISGPLRVGEKLTVSIRPPGARIMTFRPVLLAVDPGRELRWQGRLVVPRLFDGQHFFRLSKMGGRTLFEHGEQFEGLLVGALGSNRLEQIKHGFMLMNEALKGRAEAVDVAAG